MRKKLVAVFMGAVLVAPIVAQAEGSYVKLGVGQSEYKNSRASENETAASLAYGFSIDKNFAVELVTSILENIKKAVQSSPIHFNVKHFILQALVLFHSRMPSRYLPSWVLLPTGTSINFPRLVSAKQRR